MLKEIDIEKIYLDPRSNSVYSSYYIRGIQDYFVGVPITYSYKYFKEVDMLHLIPNEKDPGGGDDPRILLFAIRTCEKRIKKVAVDYRDNIVVYQQAYDWCDVYAKINCNLSETDKSYKDKMLCIAPGFGLHYSLHEALKVLLNGVYCYFPTRKIWVNPKLYVRNAFSPYLRRFPISDYSRPLAVKRDYVFFISSLWNKKESTFADFNNDIDSVNNWRIQYIRCVKENANLTFEGGLYGNHIPKGCEDFIFTHFMPTADYIRKTKESLFVFNTPSVWGCHGWKLGEFLAMGKAIISTPLNNDLPSPLVHGEQIHYVNSYAELEEAVRLLSSDSDYRHRLETGAKQYFETYCTPVSVIKQIFNSLN